MNRQLPPELLADLQSADKYGGTQLHKAAQRGDLATMMQAAAAGCSLRIKNQKGLLPLHEACLEGHTRIVHLLLALGTDVNARTGESWTPLICAAGNGHLDTTKILVASGADLDSTTSTGHSAAHMAAWKGLTDILVVLCQNGCSLNMKTDEGQTPLDLAIESEQQDCVAHIKASIENKELEDNLRREYDTKLQLEQRRNINQREGLHIRIQELELAVRLLPSRHQQQPAGNNLIRSTSVPLELSLPQPPSQTLSHSTSHSTSAPCSPLSPTSFPPLVRTSSDDVFHNAGYSPSPPASPRPRRRANARQGVMSPLASRPWETRQTNSALNEQQRSQSVPQDLNLICVSHSQANKGTAQTTSTSIGIKQTGRRVVVSPDKQTGRTRRVRFPQGSWSETSRKREEFFGNKWEDVAQKEDEQLMKLPFTELHRQSLQNPDSMANVTKVSTM